jgi:hypothetical protein
MPALDVPKAMRSTISEDSDLLRISIPSKRNWFDALFIVAWVTFWFFLGRSSFRTFGRVDDPVWLGFWILGLFWAFRALLRMLAGREVMIATPENVDVRKEILGIGITRRYPVAQLRWLRFQPATGRGKSYRPSHVAFECHDKTVCFGLGIDQAEATYIIALLTQRYPIPGPVRQSGVTLRRPDLEGLAALRGRQGVWMGLVLFGICFVILAARMPSYLREIRSAKWPTASGIIVDSHSSSVRLGHSEQFALEIRYEYPVGTRQFTGSSVNFQPQDRLHSKEYAERVLKRYPVGKSVVVSYDPQNPDSAVLEAGITSERHVLFYLGIGFMAMFGGGFVYMLWLSLHSKPSRDSVAPDTRL